MATINVLMFGWELPPHMTGGLGTACAGISCGLFELGGTSTTFVLPTVRGDEVHQFDALIDAGICQGARVDGNTPGATGQAMSVLPAPPPAAERHHVFQRERESLRRLWARHLPQCVSALPEAAPDDEEPEWWAPLPGMSARGGAYDGGSIQRAIDYAGKAGMIVANAGKIDLLHAHDWITFLLAAEIKTLTELPLVVHVHSTEFDRAGAHANRNVIEIERLGLLVADKIVAVSRRTKANIVERYDIDPSKIEVVYNGAERCAMPASQPAAIRRQERVVSYIGRVTHQKGPTYFIEAAYRLLQRTNSLRFVMAGDGDLLDMAKALVSALGMEGQFEFPGFLSRDQVIATLGRTDVYVMPSVSEPFGIGAIEAILAGVPVVVSEHAGVAEVIDQVVRIDPEDTDAIADAVWFLLEHPADRQAMVTSAIQQAEALSWQRSAQVLLDVYRALLSTI